MSKWIEVLHEELKAHFLGIYDGTIPLPCTEDCAAGCDGEHYIPRERYKELFQLDDFEPKGDK